MLIRNTKSSWGSLSKALHWIIVLLIINQWVIAERAASLPKGPALINALAWHKSFGITILLLAVIRLLWRWMNPTPVLPGTLKPYERALASFTHATLYVLLFIMPLSGWMMSSARGFPVAWFGFFPKSWFGSVQLPDLVPKNKPLYDAMLTTHQILQWVLYAVVALHVLAALKHHFMLKDNVLKRMLPFTKVM